MTMTNRRIRFGKFLLAGGLLCGAAVIPMSVSSASNGPKVTICHRTNAVSNPYRQITVDRAAVDGQGAADHYGRHQGPVFTDGLKPTGQKWGDIIPPVPGYHDGLNWTDEGRAIWDNGCVLPGEVTTTTEGDGSTTTTEGVDDTTTSTTEDPTTTTEPPSTTTSTTSPEVTVTTDTLPPGIDTALTITQHGAAVPVEGEVPFTG